MYKAQVTVFIPTFNRLAYVQKAVGSVLAQGDFVRLHVLDNASSDGTREWLSELAVADGRVQLTLRDHNIGAAQNFMDGFDSVQTPYLVPLADDDELFPGFLSSALAIAANHESTGAVIFQTIGESDGKVIIVSPDTQARGYLDVGPHLVAWARSGHYVSWSSILWSTEAVRESNAVREMLIYGLPGDVWFQFKVFSKRPVYLVPERGSRYNFHAGQAWREIGPSTMRDFGRIITNVRRKLKGSASLRDEEIHQIAVNLSGHFCLLMKNITDSAPHAYKCQDLLIGSAFFVKHMYPLVGFRHFPFFSLLSKCMPVHRKKG